MYQDDGCEVSTSCLSCPLPECKHDNPGAYYRHTTWLKLQQAGLTFSSTRMEIAQCLGVRVREIRRIKARLSLL